eukprot:1758262-Pyramimonas_sp.AAC.4
MDMCARLPSACSPRVSGQGISAADEAGMQIWIARGVVWTDPLKAELAIALGRASGPPIYKTGR